MGKIISKEALIVFLDMTDSYISKRGISALLYVINLFYKVYIMIYWPMNEDKNLIRKHPNPKFKKKTRLSVECFRINI